MKVLHATIERSEDAFFAYINDMDGFVSGGNSYDEVKSNLMEIFKEFVDEDEEIRKKYRNGYKLRFEVNLASFFDLVPEVNISQLAKTGGINPGLLRQYVSGTRKASEKQAERVMKAIEKLAAKLNSLSLTA